jgi:hypothetical protein
MNEDTGKRACPQGFTKQDLEHLCENYLLDRELFFTRLRQHFTGKTLGECTGQIYIHNREHNEHCQDIGHTSDSPFDYNCGYPGGGAWVDTCEIPHGNVYFTWDIREFLRIFQTV